MSKENWTHDNIPDQTGKVAIVTGANSGIGLETARSLASRGARVILACRNESKAQAAMEDIRRSDPQAKLEFIRLDLADLDSIETFASAVLEREQSLDLLINNAGVMVPPESKTKQGFELQFGVNHLGHFALTGRLLPLLLATKGARIVNVSSVAHKFGKMKFDDLDFESRGYKAGPAYGQSKLANLLFTPELRKRLAAAGASLRVTAAHPGWTSTNLQQHASMAERLNPLFAMKAPDGALPTLRAATDPSAQSGDYYGPKGLWEMRGTPVKVGRTKAARNEADASTLWTISEQRTGVTFNFGAKANQAA